MLLFNIIDIKYYIFYTNDHRHDIHNNHYHQITTFELYDVKFTKSEFFFLNSLLCFFFFVVRYEVVLFNYKVEI